MDPETPGGSRGGGEAPRAGGDEEPSGIEKRQWPRRTLPFGRGAVLEIGGRSHIVGLRDLSEGGALLVTRARAAEGEAVLLKLSMVSRRVEVRISGTVVRIVQAESDGCQRGLAVRFENIDDEVRASIATFVARAPGGRQG
jgi:Tfp pilus assembly protein PilZ